MKKSDVTRICGNGLQLAAAEFIGVHKVTYCRWPQRLPVEIADRIRGVMVRKGIEMPDEFLGRKAALARGNGRL